MMKPRRLFRCAFPQYSNPYIDDDFSAPARLQTTTSGETLSSPSWCRSCPTLRSDFSYRSLISPSENETCVDDCTVASNASTVKAGTIRHPRRQTHEMQDETRGSAHWRELSRQRLSALALNSTPSSSNIRDQPDEIGEKCHREKRLLFSWKNGIVVRNEKLSPAALQLAREAALQTNVRPRQKGRIERRISRHESMISLPMKRFLIDPVSDVDVCYSIAEF